MGKWIAAFLILIFLVAPVPFILASSGQQLAAHLGIQISSWLFVPKDMAALGQKFFDDVRVRDFQPVLNAIGLKEITPQAQAQLTQLADVFPNEKPLSVKLVGINVNVVPSRTYQLTYEYEFLRRWILASIIFSRSGDSLNIQWHAEPLAESLEQSNALTFVGKSQKYYLFAGAAALMYVFSIVSAYACLFTPMARRKWLWVIFVMLGFMALNLNWTTGQLSYQLLTVFAPAAWIGTGSGFTPFIVQIGLPLGAIAFWLRRRALMEVPAQRGDDAQRVQE